MTTFLTITTIIGIIVVLLNGALYGYLDAKGDTHLLRPHKGLFEFCHLASGFIVAGGFFVLVYNFPKITMLIATLIALYFTISITYKTLVNVFKSIAEERREMEGKK